MFARNLLQAGDYVVVVPLGLPISIKYGDKGAVEKVFVGHEDDAGDDITDDVLTMMLVNKQIPNHVSTKGVDCFVHAVMYSSELQFGRGRLPDCLVDSYLDAYLLEPKRFSIHAGDMYIPDLSLKNTSITNRQWLTNNQFNVLPGYVVPMDIDELKFESMVKKNFPFRYPLISSFIIFHRDGNISYPSTGLTMFEVDDVNMRLDMYGNILGDVKEKNSETVVTVPYPQVVQNDIQKDSVVVCDSDGNFIYVHNDSSATKLPRKITCSECGKQLVVPSANVLSFKCLDSQCNSVLYPRVLQILKTFDLLEISFERYLEVSRQIGPIFGVLDIFDLDEYKDIEINTTFVNIVRAIIPKDILPNINHVRELCTGCNNSVEAITYYFNHPQAIISDLNCDIHVFNKLINWLGNVENCADCTGIFDIPNIHIESEVKTVNGSPIFRNKTIFITGTFSHGTLDDIVSIFEGYSAEVTKQFDPSVDCIVVGDIPENVNGYAVSQAKQLSIPVMDEYTFFRQYQIDEDLK